MLDVRLRVAYHRANVQTLISRDIVPPANGAGQHFRYLHAETGHWTVAPTYYDWVDQAKQHRRANDLPIPLDFEEQMQDQLCATLPPEWCAHEAGDKRPVNTQFSLRDVTDAMKVFGKWMVSGFQTVEQAEAERRAGICVRCYLNVEAAGCGACSGIAKLISGVFSSKKTSQDARLKVCANCRCVNRVQVWVPLEALAEKNAEVRASWPSFCWQSA